MSSEDRPGSHEPSGAQAAGEFLRTLFFMALVVFSLRSSLVDWYEVPSGSMLPTIQEGDRIFVNKMAYSLRVPFTEISLVETGSLSRGDIVVFLYPIDRRTDYVKRLVGLPGDKIAIKDNILYINDEPQPRRAVTLAELPPGAEVEQGADLYVETLAGIDHLVWERVIEPDFGPIIVPPNSFFVIGDNRDNSSDSRAWGDVPMELLKGRALGVVASLQQATPLRYAEEAEVSDKARAVLTFLKGFLDPRRIRLDRFFQPLEFEESSS